MSAPDRVAKQTNSPLRLLRVEPIQLPVAALMAEIDRSQREVYAAMEDAEGGVPTWSIYNIRTGRQWPWRTTARQLLAAIQAGVPVGQVAPVATTLEAWIRRVAKEAEPKGPRQFYQSAPTRRKRSSCRTRPRRVVA
jgi:hypothetical protein